MSEILDQLRAWGCCEPKETSTPEERALYELLSRSLAVAVAADVGAHVGYVALASLNELVSRVEALRRGIEGSTGIKAILPESRGRVEILNWRKHGDNESYCRVEVFGMGDTTETETLIAKEYDVWVGAEDEGNYGATYYVNDDIIIADGDIKASHDGRRFRFNVVLMD